MTNTVRPASRRSIASCTNRSDSESSADVASCGRLDLRIGEPVGRAVRDVPAHRIVEQHRILAHDSRESAQRCERDLARIDSVQQDAASRRLVEARNEIDERALPRSTGPYEGRDRSATRCEGYVAEHVVIAIREAHALELKGVAQLVDDARAAILLRLRREIEDLEEAFRRRERLLRRRE